MYIYVYIYIYTYKRRVSVNAFVCTRERVCVWISKCV